MNTDTKRVLTAEQKARKNQLAKERRAKKKAEKEQEILSQIPEAVESDDSDENDGDIEIDTVEDPVVVDEEEERKRAIAEKRRQSLALARSKIKPKSQITKEKDDEIQKIKEENARLKMEAEKALEKSKIQQVQQKQKPKTKVIKKIIKQEPKPTPQERTSIGYLTEQTYGEQLQARLRENMLNKIMMDTFM